MNIILEKKFIRLFPDVKIGVLICQKINNKQSFENLDLQIRKEEKKIRENYSLESITSIPKIFNWREAYKKFGCKPSSYRSSIEALIRRILKGNNLPSINTLVDLYNLVSIKHFFPVGGDDIDKVEGDIVLTIAQGSEHFIMLGSDTFQEIKKGEVIYKDDKEVLCRAWNYRECDKTKITQDTKNVCLVIEGLANSTKEEIQKALSDLKSLVQTYCTGTCQEFFLDKDNLKLY